MPHQVRCTDSGLSADGYSMSAAEARDMAKQLREAADALDPFPSDEEINTDNDPPKCRACKGSGKITLAYSVSDCDDCLGTGY